MGVNWSDALRPPIQVNWEDLCVEYASLSDLGIDLEFVREYEVRASGGAVPMFTDVSGARFRILVESLEVVLCVPVPSDYHPAQLSLAQIRTGDSTWIVEHLQGQAHRALAVDDHSFFPVPWDEVQALSSLREDSALVDPDMSWREFDEIWLGEVDPAPPISLRAILQGKMWWKRRSH